ncbi:MAG TPA: S9 family peptidase [Bacteroidales bacterium]|nr:MAG: peptidase S9 [Bacteroidetes bacterium GWE2_42_24]OFY28226.1 MAG: peptidase S9 [Bacteroidetes bacterium GWF2_43_11]HBZ65674.1 S9 family peptidase [Bacteroidales bacterium]
MKSSFRSVLLILFLSVLSVASSQETLTLEKIFNEGLLNTKGMAPVRWLPDGDSYLTMERREGSSMRDMVKVDAKTDKRKVLVAGEKFVPEGSNKPLRLSGYTWSGDNSKLLLFTNTQRVWRYNTRGDYWVLDVKSGKLQQLGKNLPESSLMFAKFSPDATRVAYVSRNNIYVELLADGTAKQLTSDGNEYIVNGTFDWVYEEEFDCRDGFRWSPDGLTIAFWQSDTRGTGVFNMINNVDSIYPSIIPIPYPKVGTTLSAVRVGVISSDGGDTRWISIPGNPRDNYLPRMDFIPESNDLFIQQFNRLQNTNTVWTANTESLKTAVLFVETDKAWVDVYDDTKWLDKNHSFTWTSERDGWRRLYRVTRNGQQFMPITGPNFDLISVLQIDEKGGYVYYLASPENPIEKYLYRSRLDGKGVPERITPDNTHGHHSYNISPNGRWAVHTFHNSTTPPVYTLVSLPAHKVIREFENNQAVVTEFGALQINPHQFFKVNVGDVTLDGWMIKPPHFDPAKKYPVIFHVYGEPAGSTVQNSWEGGDLWHEYLAQQGYIVMSVDNRGVNLPRGRDWRKCIYEKVGIIAPGDQAAAVQEIIKTYPFVDAERIGVWGWSGGGSMTLNAMFRYPDLYKTGIAVAFVADQRLYDAVYQERYMGLPSTNAEGYKDGSPINHAGNLKGNLLLVHGTGDDNVHYQNCEMLVNELVKNNKLFQMLAYPMRSHGIYEREGTTLHLYRSMEKFWKDNLAAGPR